MCMYCKRKMTIENEMIEFLADYDKGKVCDSAVNKFYALNNKYNENEGDLN